MRQVRDESGAIDMTGYRLCLLDRMRVAIRRRDLFVGPSFRYNDPRKGLLEGDGMGGGPARSVPYTRGIEPGKQGIAASHTNP